MRREINKQLKFLTQLLVQKSISIHQNWPSFNSEKRVIVWDNYKNLAFILKDEPYETIYEECRRNQDYNFLLLDGAIVQMQYNFDNHDKLVGHILSFYPHYKLARYQDIPQEYEELFFGNELFTDIIEGKAIAFPLRFDFTQEHTEIIHPQIHATLGNYADCRIPINKPISPKRFLSFILRNFYFKKYLEKNLRECLYDNLNFEEMITKEEKSLLHFSYS